MQSDVKHLRIVHSLRAFARASTDAACDVDRCSPYPRCSAAHLLSDVASFLISLFAVWLAERPATTVATFGYHRIEIFGALGSVVLIWFLTGILCYEAVHRLLNPSPVDGKIMFITATAGLFVNLAMMKILHQGHGHGHGGHGHSHGGGGHGHSHGGHGHGGGEASTEEDNINVRAAFIHVVGDLVQSIGVMIAAGIIWANPDMHMADPICTFLFSVLVLFTTVGILRTAFHTLLNAVPTNISLIKLVTDLYAVSGVSNIHDVHVWSYGQGRVALTAHVVADQPEQALLDAQKVALKHGIKHSTFQIERCGTEDVSSCAEVNVLSADCVIDLAQAPGAAGKRSHSHSHGSQDAHGSHSHGAEGQPLPLALLRQDTSLLSRPSPTMRHVGQDGAEHVVSPRITGTPGGASAAVGNSGSILSGASSQGRTSPGKDFSGHPLLAQAGHSHGPGSSHVHSHVGHGRQEEADDGHGHSHSHGHGHGSHGHSH